MFSSCKGATPLVQNMQAYHRQDTVAVQNILSWLQAPPASRHHSTPCLTLLLGAGHASSQAASSRGMLSCSTPGRGRGTLWAIPSSSSGVISQGMSGGGATTPTLGSGSRPGTAQDMGTLTLLETACTATPAPQVRAGWLFCSACFRKSLPAAAGFCCCQISLLVLHHSSADAPGQADCRFACIIQPSCEQHTLQCTVHGSSRHVLWDAISCLNLLKAMTATQFFVAPSLLAST